MNAGTEKKLIAELDIFRGTTGTNPKFETDIRLRVKIRFFNVT